MIAPRLPDLRCDSTENERKQATERFRDDNCPLRDVLEDVRRIATEVNTKAAKFDKSSEVKSGIESR